MIEIEEDASIKFLFGILILFRHRIDCHNLSVIRHFLHLNNSEWKFLDFSLRQDTLRQDSEGNQGEENFSFSIE